MADVISLTKFCLKKMLQSVLPLTEPSYPWYPFMCKLRRKVFTPKDAMTRGYKSQYGQDRFVANLLGGKRGGVFVDIGAHDGTSYSNSLLFEEELGWSGVCIEPNPEPFAKLQDCRKCVCIQAAVSDKPGKAEFVQLTGYGEMLSGLVSGVKRDEMQDAINNHGAQMQTVTVNCVRLGDVLRQHQIDKVDYLSIDTEGIEFTILQTIPLHDLDITVITIENNFTDGRIERYLRSKGYRLIAILSCDEVYLKKDHHLPKIYL